MNSDVIPSALIERWEREAMEQKVSRYEIVNFMRTKERLYRQSIERSEPKEKVFTNDARNRLTEYGNKVVVNYFLAIPAEERTCKLCRYDMEELQRKLSQGFANEQQKENFLSEREHWFMHLKERMKDLRMSKETLESFGLSWKTLKSFAYQTI